MGASNTAQKDKAATLLSLHTTGTLLILPNVWNPIGARILQAKGYPAVATASAAISASLGFRDGERMKRTTMIEIVGRIARCVDVPVTADIEAGYGRTPSELEETNWSRRRGDREGTSGPDNLSDQHPRIAGRCAAAGAGNHRSQSRQLRPLCVPVVPEEI